MCCLFTRPPIDDGLIDDASFLSAPVTFSFDRDDMQDDGIDSNDTIPEADDPAVANAQQQPSRQSLKEFQLAEDIRFDTAASLVDVQSPRSSTGITLSSKASSSTTFDYKSLNGAFD